MTPDDAAAAPPSEPGVGAAWPEVTRWRRAERARLLAARMALGVETRARHSERIAERLRPLVGDVDGAAISFYWPIKGEPDLRPLMRALHEAGAICALPVVEEKGRPLTFRRWTPDAKMTRGVWNIPIPAAPDMVTPQILMAPVVGFDEAGYRLGYGGGFFDRTLAQAGGDARAIGVGYEAGRIRTIHPQAHDIALGGVVTERQLHPRV